MNEEGKNGPKSEGLAPTIVEEAPLALILTEDGISRFEAQVEFYKRFVTACYKVTQPKHWINHGTKDEPKYSLQGPGAEALSTPLGIYEDPPIIREVKRHDAAGEFYAFEVEGIVHSRTLKRYGWFVGECTSRDQFFTAKKSFDPERDKHLIRNSALTNWRVNGVCRLAGMRNPDPEILKAAGLNVAAIPHVDYSGRTSPEKEKEPISEAQRKRLWTICKSQNVSEEVLRVHLLEAYSFKSTSEVTRGTYDAICAWAERGGQEEPK